jgi:HEAT repeat protein
MRPGMLAVVGIGFVCSAVQAQDKNDDRLARLLSDEKTQVKTVADIVASGRDKLPLLLSWTTTPPDGLDPFDLMTLNVALADIFGRLQTKEAIPFLVKNVRIWRWRVLMPGFGVKEDRVVLERMPAVAALVDIGSPALEPLERAFSSGATAEERLPLIFAISHIVTRMSRQDPQREHARTFLHSALADLNLERSFLQDALKALEPLAH